MQSEFLEKTTMPPTLYHVPKTISSPIVQALAELDLVDNPIKIETLTFADLKSPEHLARNPMGSSPAFVDDDRSIQIWESGAVLSYLLETYDPSHTLWIAPGQPDRAKFLHLQQYILATVYPFLASLYIHTLKPTEEQDADYVETAKIKFTTLLGPTLTNFLGDGPYFMGESLTVIDLLIAKPMNNANSLGLLQNFPTLKAVFDKVSRLPSFAVAYHLEQSNCVECYREIMTVPERIVKRQVGTRHLHQE